MDHMPIISVLEMEPERSAHVEKYNFKLMDWDDFRKTLEMKLAMVQTVEEFMTEADLLEQITKLDAAIKETIKEQVPINKPSPYAKRWWTKNLTKMKKHKERLARLSYRKRAEDEDPSSRGI